MTSRHDFRSLTRWRAISNSRRGVKGTFKAPSRLWEASTQPSFERFGPARKPTGDEGQALTPAREYQSAGQTYQHDKNSEQKGGCRRAGTAYPNGTEKVDVGNLSDAKSIN